MANIPVGALVQHPQFTNTNQHLSLHMLHIGISGAHGVGKSTLIQEIRSIIGKPLHVVSGVAQGVLGKGYKLGKAATVDSYVCLIADYLHARNETIRSTAKIVLWDRVLLDTLSYFRVNRVLGIDQGLNISHLLETLCEDDSRRFSAFAVVPIEFPENLGSSSRQRDEPYRQLVQDELVRSITAHGAEPKMICGTLENRVVLLSELIMNCLNEVERRPGCRNES